MVCFSLLNVQCHRDGDLPTTVSSMLRVPQDQGTQALLPCWARQWRCITLALAAKIKTPNAYKRLFLWDMVLYSVAEGEHKDGVCHQSEAKVERWSARMMLTSLCPRKVFEQELKLLFNIHKWASTGHHSAWHGPSSHLERPVESEVWHTGPTPTDRFSHGESGLHFT